jgi:beta-glucosidase
MNKPAKEIAATQDLEAKVEALLSQMTLEEQVLLLSGEDHWSLPALPRLGLGKLRVTDGPNGARGSGSAVQGSTSAAFPVAISLGATWNTELAREIGKALAEEVKTKDAHVSLAPTVNMHRSVANGRNFECFSEDPELSADLTAAFVNGLQGEGIAATVKHFAGNESEVERTTINSVIDERTLREVYLRPFEAAVKDANAWGVMSSYNKLNGTYTAENKWLLTDVLRDDWGFDGAVMSDWFGSRTTAPTVNAGLDIEMPGPTRDRGAKLVAAVEAGEVSAETVRERARAVLRLMGRVGLLDQTPEFNERSIDRPEHRALIRKAGAEGIVMLKNAGLLPVAEGKKIAAIGPNTKIAQIMGGGSSQLNPHYRVSPWEALESRLGTDALIYAHGCQNHRWEPILHGHLDIEFFATTDLSGPVVARAAGKASVDFWNPPQEDGKIDPKKFSARVKTDFLAEATGRYSFGLHAAGRARLYVNGTLVVDVWDNWTKGRTFFEEGCDEVTGTIRLEAGQTYEIVMDFATVPASNLSNPAFRFGVSMPLGDEAIEEAVAAAKAADIALLFVGRNGEWDTEGSDLDHIRLPGRQDELIEKVAAANKNVVVVLQTGGPIEMPWLDKVGAVLQAWYPGQEAGNAIADVLFGDAEPGGRLPQTFPMRWEDNPTHTDDPEIYPGKDGRVRYDEGVFIGHRHYDAKGITPLFPFGFGLSYSEFSLNGIEIDTGPDEVVVSTTLQNIGARAGSTVVQLYVGEEAPKVSRPIRELKAFSKVALAAGESRKVSLTLAARDFAYFDGTAGLWRVDAGMFRLSLGFSAADLRGEATITRPSRTIAK